MGQVDSLRGRVTSRISERPCDIQLTKFRSSVWRVFGEVEDGCCYVACFQMVNCTSVIFR